MNDQTNPKATGAEPGPTKRVDRLGDPLPPGAVQRLGTQRMRYWVRDIAYSASGKQAYVISGPELHAWDLGRGLRTAVHAVSNANLTAMDCHAPARRALFGDRDGALIEWDLAEAREVRRLDTGAGSPASVRYAKDGARALVLDPGAQTVSEWELEAGRKRISVTAPDGTFRLCIYGPGNTVFVGHQPDDNVYHYDLDTGELLKSFDPNYIIYDMCLSPDEQRLLVGTRQRASEWRIDGYERLQMFRGHRGHAVPAVAYTRDDAYLLTGSRDGSIRMWDRARGEVVRHWYPHQRHVREMRVSPDGEWVLSFGSDRLFLETSLETGEPRLQWDRHRSTVQALALTPDGARAVSGSADATARVWRTDGWKPVREIQSPGDEVHGLAVSPNGRRLALGCKDGTVREALLDTGEVLRMYAGHRGYVRSVAYVDNDHRLLSVAGDGVLRIWDTRKGELRHTLPGHLGGLLDLAASPDGRWALTGGRDGTLREWDLTDGHLVQTAVAHRGWVRAVDYKPDGRHALSAGSDGLLIEWDLEKGRDRTGIDHGEPVNAACYLNRGRWVCTAGDEGGIQVWNLERGRRLASLGGHDEAVHALAVTPDGRYLLSGSADTTVLVWDLTALG